MNNNWGTAIGCALIALAIVAAAVLYNDAQVKVAKITQHSSNWGSIQPYGQ